MNEESCKAVTLILTTGESHEKATPLEWIEGQGVIDLASFGRVIDWVLGGVAAVAFLHVVAFIF